MSLKKFLQNVSLAGRQWDDIQFVCVLPFSSGPAHLLCLMGGALYVWQITVPQITAHHRNGPLKGAFYFLWSRGGNNIKATVKHIKWQRKPWTIYKVQYNAVKNGMLKKTEFNFFTFFFLYSWPGLEAMYYGGGKTYHPLQLATLLHFTGNMRLPWKMRAILSEFPFISILTKGNK